MPYWKNKRNDKKLLLSIWRRLPIFSRWRLSIRWTKNLKLNKKNLSLSYTRKCITNLYDILKCPLILYEKDFGYEVPAEHMRDLCGVYNSSLLYVMTHDICKPKNYNEIFGININSNLDKDMGEDEGKTSLETLFHGQAKYPYNYNEFNILLEE